MAYLNSVRYLHFPHHDVHFTKGLNTFIKPSLQKNIIKSIDKRNKNIQLNRTHTFFILFEIS